MAESALEVEREPVSGECPRCGAKDLAHYHAVSESGWVRVIKCQSCLFSLDRAPANRLGPITLLADLL